MPVRIYDISKKLGLDNKQVLAKAKELGLPAARVASSSLDKITAEYLEQQLILEHPELAAPPPPPPAPAAPPPEQAIAIPVSPPPPEAEPVQKQEVVAEVAPAPVEPAVPAPEVLPPVEQGAAPGPPAVISEPPPEAKPEPVVELPPPAPVPPPPPPRPKVGDKVGFIQLPPKPGARAAEKPGGLKPPAGRRTISTRRLPELTGVQ